jgi:hypothetical protein
MNRNTLRFSSVVGRESNDCNSFVGSGNFLNVSVFEVLFVVFDSCFVCYGIGFDTVSDDLAGFVFVDFDCSFDNLCSYCFGFDYHFYDFLPVCYLSYFDFGFFQHSFVFDFQAFGFGCDD